MSQPSEPGVDVSAWLNAAEHFDEETIVADDGESVFIGPDNAKQFFEAMRGEPVSDAAPAPAVIEPEPEPEPEEVPITRLSVKDRARLLNNRSLDANRFITSCGARHAILHLTLRDMETFRAATIDIEQLFIAYLQSGVPIDKFVIANRSAVIAILQEQIPVAASLVLRTTPEDLMLHNNPLELLEVVIEQWTHNLEINQIREMFPYPPDEDRKHTDEELGIVDDPNGENPVALIDGLCQTYHWDYERALDRTIIQVYLLGIASAWSHYRMKKESDINSEQGGGQGGKKGPQQRNGKVYYEGKWWELKKMPKGVYRRYLNEMLSMPYRGVSG